AACTFRCPGLSAKAPTLAAAPVASTRLTNERRLKVDAPGFLPESGVAVLLLRDEEFMLVRSGRVNAPCCPKVERDRPTFARRPSGDPAFGFGFVTGLFVVDYGLKTKIRCTAQLQRGP